MPYIVTEILSLLGFLLRALGFLVIGFALGRFFLDAYKKAVWQVQIALVLGIFALLIAITNLATAGSAGAFALGAGISFIISDKPKKVEEEVKENQKLAKAGPNLGPAL